VDLNEPRGLSITLVCRIFEDLKFVTGLGVLGGAEAKNRIYFCFIWSGLSATGHTFCSLFQNIEKPHQKFQKLSPTIFNLKTYFVITTCAFKC